jgi:predicted outer membrane repeat protein
LGYATQPTLNRLAVSGNYAGYQGGGAFITDQSRPSLTNIAFTGNRAGDSGGGIFTSNNSQPSLVNLLVSGNNSGSFGGGISNLSSSTTLANITIANNYATNFGGGIFNDSTITLTNSIVWGNNPSQLHNSGGSFAVNYSIVQGGFSGTGNLNADPLFVAPLPNTSAPTSLGNYRLQNGSPADLDN